MKYRFKTQKARAAPAAEVSANCSTWDVMTILTDADLRVVSGGVNPQPLPPQEEPPFI